MVLGAYHVLMEITPADPTPRRPDLDLAFATRRFRDVFDPQVLFAVEPAGFHRAARRRRGSVGVFVVAVLSGRHRGDYPGLLPGERGFFLEWTLDGK